MAEHCEIDARELRCPFIPGVDKCLTKACMAWRWTEGVTKIETLRLIPIDRTMDRAIWDASLVEDRKELQKRGFKLVRAATPGEVTETWRAFTGDNRTGVCARVDGPAPPLGSGAYR